MKQGNYFSCRLTSVIKFKVSQASWGITL